VTHDHEVPLELTGYLNTSSTHSEIRNSPDVVSSDTSEEQEDELSSSTSSELFLASDSFSTPVLSTIEHDNNEPVVVPVFQPPSEVIMRDKRKNQSQGVTESDSNSLILDPKEIQARRRLRITIYQVTTSILAMLFILDKLALV